MNTLPPVHSNVVILGGDGARTPGVVAGYGHRIGSTETKLLGPVEPMVLVTLKDGAYTEGRKHYIDTIVCHPDNLEQA